MNHVLIIAGVYGFQLLICLVFILLGVFVYDKRFKSNHGGTVPDGFVATEEINIDPVTQKRIRVYYNEKTGERFYKPEK